MNIKILPFLSADGRTVVDDWLSNELTEDEKARIVYKVAQDEWVHRLATVWGDPDRESKIKDLLPTIEQDLALTLDEAMEKYPDTTSNALIDLMVERTKEVAAFLRAVVPQREVTIASTKGGVVDLHNKKTML